MKNLIKITVLSLVAFANYAYAADDRLMYRTMCTKDECFGTDSGSAFKAACALQGSNIDQRAIGVVYSVNAGCMCPCLYEYLYYQKPVVVTPTPPTVSAPAPAKPKLPKGPADILLRGRFRW